MMVKQHVMAHVASDVYIKFQQSGHLWLRIRQNWIQHGRFLV